MIARFGPASGYISQLILGFGIGSGAVGGSSNLPKLDFSRPANSGLIAALRRF